MKVSTSHSGKSLLILVLTSVLSFLLADSHAQSPQNRTEIGDYTPKQKLDDEKLFSADISVGTAILSTWYGVSVELINTKVKKSLRTVSRLSMGSISIYHFGQPRGEDGINFSLSQQLLLGQHTKFFECGLGLSLLKWNYYSGDTRTDSEIIPLPSINLGYRHQTNNTKFRLGIGYPEMVYIGLGF